MLEPVGISPVETLLPRNQNGEGLAVRGLGRKGLVGWTSCRVPCACACQLWSHLLPQAPALKMGLLGHFPFAPSLPIAGSP